MDEFEAIARLFAPLTQDAPEALGLADDAALLPGRPGFDLVVTKDAMVEGVHFLSDDPPELVARKLLRANLSDLAAKGAEPYGYFLAVAWPHGYGGAAKAAFAAGLGQDQAAFGVRLFGGDTVSTAGPLTASITLMGWVPAGAMVRRAGARPGHVLLVTGSIGDGGLGLKAARGELAHLGTAHLEALARRYRLPEPRIGLAEAMRAHAAAAIDVSDGLVADLVHLEEAGGVAVQLDLERLPLSPAAKAWVAGQPDPARALAELATCGDDYELLIAADPDQALALSLAAARVGVPLTPVGRVHEGQGTLVLHRGAPVLLDRVGWRHG